MNIIGINKSQNIKRLFDVSFSLSTLIIGLPVFLAIGLAIKLNSRGPVLFLQWRNGLNGQEFQIYKFRTMVVHSEQPDIVTQASRKDKRITRVGRFLRKTSLDELPQFLNVLKGEMSVIGPRPHAVAHNREYSKKIECYSNRHDVKPGISGLAQVNGHRGETETLDKMKLRVKDDIAYVKNWSICGDLKILLKTLLFGFGGKNAF